MKKLILSLMFLSSCDVTPAAKAYEPPIMCMASAIVDDDGWSALRLSGSIDRSELSAQARITMNNDVMVDTCAMSSAPGFTVYPDDEALYLSFDFKKNLAWRNEYFDSQNKPIKTDLSFKVETKATCSEAWTEPRPYFVEIIWSETTGGCTPPGVYGYITEPSYPL